MYLTNLKLFLVILYLNWAPLVSAGLYVISPSDGSECVANQPCTVTWLDDGRQPLLTAVGVSTIGLYTGRQRLVQSITPVDVSTVHSLTFQPNPAAGPNDGGYYIAIQSTEFKTNNSMPYTSFSPFFRLSGMTGSFDSPLPAATSPIPIPPSLTQIPSSSATSTITVGGPSHATPQPPITTAPFTQSPSVSPSDNPTVSSASSQGTSTLTFPTSFRMTTSVLSSTTSSSANAASSSSSSSAGARTVAQLSTLSLVFAVSMILAWS
ncbi:hypothetical protein CPB83DRAFT_101458 [Crepidotus variabilis]|uniref:Yeast cell wall synthesis Kre9/Knh1-like N-terminal domain-containing protein n=1 Tax=Crepidotus variabilis TaxID=179855 RepID=A0A9P6EM03_9AGAR|nr:hypothetical protein CPB83DRAFT_101458 [Crepidotus variabilis]